MGGFERDWLSITRQGSTNFRNNQARALPRGKPFASRVRLGRRVVWTVVDVYQWIIWGKRNASDYHLTGSSRLTVRQYEHWIFAQTAQGVQVRDLG